jgi:uncharacterized membrane protein YidH (DUF202 family)
MSERQSIDDLVKEDLDVNPGLPAIPDIGEPDPDRASVAYSLHRTKLSTHRTALSQHRTELSTHRTQLSQHRTDLSTRRTEMSARRTGMSFQRTRMSADRTLMSVIRTALALISFGFTIYQFLGRLMDQKILAGDPHAARNFGLALVYLGVAMVVAGIVYHLQFMWGLREEREIMRGNGLIHANSRFPVSFTLVVALLLLLLGVMAAANLTFRTGPFD